MSDDNNPLLKSNPNVVVWFEVPVTDIARAAEFYGTVLSTKLDTMEMGPIKMAVFPGGEGTTTVHGCLVGDPSRKPSADGPLVYFNGGDDLAVPLARVEAAGGKIIEPKAAIGEHGFWALIEDTEGNRVALHSPG